MKLVNIASAIGATLLLQASVASAKSHLTHNHLHALERKHVHHERKARQSPAESAALEIREDGEVESALERRQGQCIFPTNDGLVAVTPDQQNAGWAMSPNQPCLPNNYCPFACPSGQMMAQWNPAVTTYVYPGSMQGGLYCDADGVMQKPFPNQPYCMTGSTSIGAIDKTGKGVAVCQTVLPGNEAMLIPNWVDSSLTLATPNLNYWAQTASQFYINYPGTSTDDSCVWSDGSAPLGNWAPYTIGQNQVAGGEIFIKIGWNPIYLQQSTTFRNIMPNFGVTIQCEEGAACNGLPCTIDPTVNGVNEMIGGQGDGAGGANFCVVTVPAGATANYIIFEGSVNDIGSDNQNVNSTPPPASSPAAAPAAVPSVAATSISAAAKPAVSSSSSSPSSATTSATGSLTTPTTSFTYSPHVLHENATSAATGSASADASGSTALVSASTASASGLATTSSSSPSSNAGIALRASIGGLAIALAAAAALAL